MPLSDPTHFTHSFWQDARATPYKLISTLWGKYGGISPCISRTTRTYGESTIWACWLYIRESHSHEHPWTKLAENPKNINVNKEWGSVKLHDHIDFLRVWFYSRSFLSHSYQPMSGQKLGIMSLPRNCKNTKIKKAIVGRFCPLLLHFVQK